MGTNNYIAAVEIGSSKVSGAIAVKTYDGIKIEAFASETVNGFIAKGVVRNVDETGNSLTSLINKLETQLNGITIEKAYVAFDAVSTKSIPSTVVKDFDEYTKITQEIIDEISLENDALFIVPDGYRKIHVVTQECKLNGDTSTMPIGIPTRRIECKYLNIIVKEQYLKQLEESFDMSAISIMDCFSGTRIEADILLSDEERQGGCALVDIGSETTTVAVYTNNILRKLTVLPLGSENITKDLCTEDISHQEAEQMKIFKGYRSTAGDNSALPTELVDQIIGARMTEILSNIKNQIDASGEIISRVIFCGGGARLKNIELLIAECMPNVKTRIATEPELNYICNDKLSVTKGAITPTLLALLKTGKENCCKEELPEQPAAPVQPPTNLFGEEILPREPEEKAKKTVTKDKPTKETKEEKEKGKNIFSTLFGRIKNGAEIVVGEMTRDDEEDDENDN